METANLIHAAFLITSLLFVIAMTLLTIALSFTEDNN